MNPEVIRKPLSRIKFRFIGLFYLSESKACRETVENCSIAGEFRRIYFYHIRKTAGTSLNAALLSLGDEDGNVIYNAINNERTHRIISGDKVFVGWNPVFINQGNYFYAFSHTAAHYLCVPPKTFTFTCLRDPAQRTLSLYRMILKYRKNNDRHPRFRKQVQWLGDSFEDFLKRAPSHELLAQLYMFSRRRDVSEALENVLRCNHILFVETFENDVQALAGKLELPLKILHANKSEVDVMISESEEAQLRERLAPEYQFYEAVKKHLGRS